MLVATKYDPTSVLRALLPFLVPSGQFVIFSQYREPLAQAYTYLKVRHVCVLCVCLCLCLVCVRARGQAEQQQLARHT